MLNSIALRFSFGNRRIRSVHPTNSVKGVAVGLPIEKSGGRQLNISYPYPVHRYLCIVVNRKTSPVPISAGNNCGKIDTPTIHNGNSSLDSVVSKFLPLQLRAVKIKESWHAVALYDN